MSVRREYPNGTTVARIHAGVPPDAKRGVVAGWSSQAAGRHKRWLMSVNIAALGDEVELFAYTLTVRDVPGSSAKFHQLRRSWIRRVERALRLGGSRLPSGGHGFRPLWCWVMEWQKRGAPHLHGVIVAPKGSRALVGELVYVAWPDVAQEWGASPGGQDVKLVAGAAGWLAYLAKHIGRSPGHGQRKGLPPGWEASGRLWGHSQGWPTQERVWEVTGPSDRHALALQRRLLFAWAMANARSERDPVRRKRRMLALRRQRSRPDRTTSEWIAGSEWVPDHVSRRMLEWIVTQGFEVVDRVTGELFE